MRQQKRYYLAALLFFSSGLLGGCGDDEQLPPGTAVQITTGDRKFTVTELRDDADVCIWFDENHLDIPVSIQVVNGQGSPIGEAELTLYVDWSGNTYPGREALKLYEDRNGNGVVDDPAELVSGSDDEIFVTRTRRYSGDKLMLLRVNLSCKWRGVVYAIAGGYSASMEIEVQADNEEQPGG